MKKEDRIEAYLEQLAHGSLFERCYTGYFLCFNRGDYYEAHDVLEHLWLKNRRAPEARFYQGLIQVAGGFVHLKKQYLRPDHPTDGRRLHPAARLFQLARQNLQPYRPRFLELDVALLDENCEAVIRAIEAGDYRRNPWNPARLPVLSREAVKFL